MSEINQEINALVQLDLDGVISAEQRARLQQYLDSSEEVRAFHADCRRLVETLNGLEALEPPPGLDDSILAAVRDRAGSVEDGAAEQGEQESGLRGLLAIWLNFPVLRYASVFLLGALLTTLVSERGLDTAPTRLVDLAGTMSPAPEFTLLETRLLQSSGADLRLDLLKSDALLQIRFALESDEPVELEVRYPSDSYGLFGFSQESGALGNLAAEDGEVTLKALGQKAFALFLMQSSGEAPGIELRLTREGVTVETLRISPDKKYLE